MVQDEIGEVARNLPMHCFASQARRFSIILKSVFMVGGGVCFLLKKMAFCSVVVE